MKYYGLKVKSVPNNYKYAKVGDLISFSCTSNEGREFCTDVAFSLGFHDDNLWLVTNRKRAETAAITDSIWYCANYETPENPYIKDGVEFEVFEIEIC